VLFLFCLLFMMGFIFLAFCFAKNEPEITAFSLGINCRQLV
jgi:hypothetical protein